MIITLVLILVVGIGAFFTGMKYQEGKTQENSSSIRQFGTSQRTNGENGRTGMQPQNGNGSAQRNGTGQVMGEILSKDETSITVKLMDGSSKIVLLSGITAVQKTVEAEQNDLTVGANVLVFGTENSDKSVTAQSIQLDPAMRGQNNPRGDGNAR